MEGTTIKRVTAPEQRRDDNPWNREVSYDYSTMWLGTKRCVQEINERITRDPDRNWLQHVIDKYIPNKTKEEIARSRCLLLGANEGYLERELCARGFTGEIVATDIADKALMRAKERADALGYRNVRYVVHDLNTPFGPEISGTFDFIFAEGVLHHIDNIEACLGECDRLLADGGHLFMVEFEGPFRFQFSELQTRWINAALGVLPKCLRPFPPAGDGDYPATPQENLSLWLVPPPEAAVAQMDPSEAVSGPRLKRLIPEVFEVVERVGYGGTILSYITQHFDFRRANDDPFTRRWLEVLMAIERAAIDTGLLDDEFVFYVVKKRARRAAAP